MSCSPPWAYGIPGADLSRHRGHVHAGFSPLLRVDLTAAGLSPCPVAVGVLNLIFIWR